MKDQRRYYFLDVVVVGDTGGYPRSRNCTRDHTDLDLGGGTLCNSTQSHRTDSKVGSNMALESGLVEIILHKGANVLCFEKYCGQWTGIAWAKIDD